MTLREGPFEAERGVSGEAWYVSTPGRFGMCISVCDADLPALRRLLERLEGRERPPRLRWPIVEDNSVCREPAQPTKGKRRR